MSNPITSSYGGGDGDNAQVVSPLRKIKAPEWVLHKRAGVLYLILSNLMLELVLF